MNLRTEVATAVELIAGAALSAALNFASIVIVARSLGPETYADFASALSVIFIATVALSPLSPAIARVVADQAMDPGAIGMLRRRLIAPAVGAALLASIVSVAVAQPLASLLRIGSATSVVVAFSVVGVFLVVSADRAFLQGLGRFRAHNVSTIVEAATRVCLTLVVLEFTLSPAAALTPYLISLVIAELVLALVLGRLPRGRRRIHRTEIVRTSGPLVLLMLGAAVLQNADMLAVRRWLPDEVAGQYGAASALTRGFGVLFVPLYVMSGPLLVTARNSGRSVTWVTVRLCSYFVAACLIPLLLMVRFDRRIISLLYGNAYAPAAEIIAPLGLVVILGYLALLIAQAHVTARDRSAPWGFVGCAIALVVALRFFHSNVHHILLCLGVIHVALISFTVVTLRRSGSSVPLQ